MLITSLALLLLNYFSAKTTRELMFRAKYASAQDKIQVVASAFSGVDPLTPESAEQVISVLGNINAARLIVTNAEGTAVYDSSENQNAIGQRVLLPAVVEALRGSDVFHSAYQDDALVSSAAVPIMDHDSPNGCVYLMDYDAEQGNIIANLERTILQGSFVLLGAIILFSAFFATTSSRRMRKILTSMRMVREGEYSHKIQMRGSDEFATLATEFNKLTDRLQESEAQQRQFVSDASHELKTPLASIKLLSDSILQNEMDPETQREFIGDIGREADRLGRLTQKLLTLTKLDSSVEEEREILDAAPVVRKVVRMLLPLARLRGIGIDTTFEPDCRVMTVEDDLYQIVFNLTENAIKYNRQDGWVGVSVRRAGDQVELRVEDNGAGIPPESMEHIFERFYRVDKARSRAAGGAGLGLSIVHDMVERSYGTITVQARPGGGTIFTVRFPHFDLEEDET